MKDKKGCDSNEVVAENNSARFRKWKKGNVNEVYCTIGKSVR